MVILGYIHRAPTHTPGNHSSESQSNCYSNISYIFTVSSAQIMNLGNEKKIAEVFKAIDSQIVNSEKQG